MVCVFVSNWILLLTNSQYDISNKIQTIQIYFNSFIHSFIQLLIYHSTWIIASHVCNKILPVDVNIFIWDCSKKQHHRHISQDAQWGFLLSDILLKKYLLFNFMNHSFAKRFICFLSENLKPSVWWTTGGGYFKIKFVRKLICNRVLTCISKCKKTFIHICIFKYVIVGKC